MAVLASVKKKIKYNQAIRFKRLMSSTVNRSRGPEFDSWEEQFLVRLFLLESELPGPLSPGNWRLTPKTK